MKDNNYESYKAKKTKEHFYSNWTAENLDGLTEDMKEYIYQKYLVKFEVFNRDGFKCQNVDCKNGLHLTMHHVKHKKNGGQDKARNCVTLCNACHQGFHKKKYPITYPEADYLPNHIRGHTFRLHKEDKVDYKAIRAELKDVRRELKFKLDEAIKKMPIGKRVWYNLTMKEILILFKWLNIPHNEWEDDEE